MTAQQTIVLYHELGSLNVYTIAYNAQWLVTDWVGRESEGNQLWFERMGEPLVGMELRDELGD